MFNFNSNVPDNIQTFLISLLQAWIDRADLPLYRVETTRYGLVSFIRAPWPLTGNDNPTVVSPAGEQDLAACQAYSAEIAADPTTHF